MIPTRFLPPPTDLPNARLSRMAQKLSVRAFGYSALSLAFMIGAALLIWFGVQVFLRPLEFAELPESESPEVAINRIKDEVEQMLDQQANAITEHEDARRQLAALAPFYEIVTSLQHVTDKLLLPKLDDVGSILSAVEDENESSGFRVDTRTYTNASGLGTVKLNRNALDWLQYQIEANGSMKRHRDAFEQLSSLNGRDVSESNLIVDAVDNFRTVFKWVTPARKAALEQLADAAEEKRNAEQAEGIDKKRMQSLNMQVSRVIAEETIQLKTWMFLQVFVPLFVIRVAVVILVLYLTRALMESYRFTMRLAAFYRCLSDALLLLEVDENGRFALEDLHGISEVFAADKHQIEKIAGAEDYLLRLLGNYSKAQSKTDRGESSESG